jgi:beta-aspartyl-peptidase (threonine type)
MPETPNPIRVAEALLDEEINGLGGIGAREWADQRGIPRSAVTPRPPGKTASGDTVGVIAMDSEGVMVTATSTGGCSDQPAGRIGDVPLPGCGFWVESGVAIAATGIGEAITREMLSHRVHGWISRDGMPMGRAFEKAIKTRFDESTDVGLIGMTSDGSCAARANTNMPWASWNSDGIRG